MRVEDTVERYLRRFAINAEDERPVYDEEFYARLAEANGELHRRYQEIVDETVQRLRDREAE